MQGSQWLTVYVVWHVQSSDADRQSFDEYIKSDERHNDSSMQFVGCTRRRLKYRVNDTRLNKLGKVNSTFAHFMHYYYAMW